MAQDERIPDWLTGLRGQQPAEEPRAPEGPQEPARSLEELLGPPPAQAVQPDTLGDLRDQIDLPEEELDSGRKARPFLGLQPWQRLVLVLFIFADVAVCGAMMLVMLGRVMLPF
jgi:hypothetical protein